MSNIFYLPIVRGSDGDKIYFTITGTTTPQNTYTDADLTIPHDNPVEADANGDFPVIYLDPELPDYRVRWTTGLGVQIGQWDEVIASSLQSSTYRLKSESPTLYFEETDGTANNKKWRIRVNAEVLTIDTGDDAESTWTSMLSVARTGAILTSGSFAATLTGMSAGGTGTIYWQKVGNIVTLRAGVSGISGTSSQNFMSLVGMPATIRPANVALTAITRVANNGGRGLADAFVQTDGEVQFSLWTSFTASSLTGFATANSKGLPTGWSTSYSLD